ncbi:transposase, partial [Xanthomonas cissicola]|uniref:transposase n=1 Tax=Xanthomonas cissicola TaxID=86186 RepID=UPI001F2DA180
MPERSTYAVSADRGSLREVAERLGVTTHSLYAWLRKFGKPGVVQRAEADQSAEVRRLKI